MLDSGKNRLTNTVVKAWDMYLKINLSGSVLPPEKPKRPAVLKPKRLAIFTGKDQIGAITTTRDDQ